jgi:hypothetical protein
VTVNTVQYPRSKLVPPKLWFIIAVYKQDRNNIKFNVLGEGNG